MIKRRRFFNLTWDILSYSLTGQTKYVEVILLYIVNQVFSPRLDQGLSYRGRSMTANTLILSKP